MRHEDRSLAGLLQALEHSLELSDRLTVALRQFIEAHHAGRSVDAATVADYEQELKTVAEQRAQVQTAIERWWALIGRNEQQ